MSQSYTIRSYAAADREQCVAAFRSNMPMYFRQNEVAEFEDWLDKFSTPESSESEFPLRYYVISKGTKVVGCGGFGLNDDRASVAFCWGLIHRDHQLSGLGKALSEFRFQEIRLLYPSIDIVLDTSHHTFSFFEKLGFVVEKITPEFYGADLHRYDMRFAVS